MSLGHLILSAGLTVYLVIGATFEERDLVDQFGTTYIEYQARVSMILPGLGRKQDWHGRSHCRDWQGDRI